MNHPSNSPNMRISLTSMMQKQLYEAHLQSGTPVSDLVLPALTNLGIAPSDIRVEGSSNIIVQLNGQAAIDTFEASFEEMADLGPAIGIDKILLDHLAPAPTGFSGII